MGKDFAGPPPDSEQKGSTTAVEDVPPSVPTTKQTRLARTRRHLRKWWWAWLIGFCLFVLVIMIVLAYGIIPSVAQKKVNGTVLTLNSLSILNPTSESFLVSLAATITGAGGIAAHAHLEPFEVVLFMESEDNSPIRPIMTLPIDQIDGGDSVSIEKRDIHVKIGDEGALDAFAKDLLDKDKMRVAMRGRTEMWLGKFHAGVDYNEVVELTALNKLTGMKIKSYELLQSDTEKYNVGGKVLIPNPSVVTIQMGDVNLGIFLEGASLGTGIIPSLTLRPGDNEYEFKALVPEDNLLSLLRAVTAKKSLTISSNGTAVNGQQIEWLSKPLRELNASVPIDT